MGNKFTSLSLGIVFSLSCLMGKVIAMEDNAIIGGEFISEQNLGELQHCKHNEGEKLTTPEDKEKSGIKNIIGLYVKKDAIDCLQKLADNAVSKGKETLHSINSHGYQFRLDQSASVTTENQSSDAKEKKSKTSKYKNKRNKKISQFDDTSSGSSTSADDDSFDEQESNKKGDAVVKINVQKGKDTYCEVIVKRSVLKYFGMSSNKTTDPDSVLRKAVNKIVDDASTKLSELCRSGRNPSKKIMESWREEVNRDFNNLKGQQMAELNAKLSKSPEAKTSWDNFRDETKKIDAKQAWNNLKTNLSNLINVEDNKNTDDIDDEKLAKLTEEIKEMLKESLDKKKVYVIYCD